MGFFRRQDGATVEIPDEQTGAALDAGFTPVTHQEHLVDLDTQAQEPDGEGTLGAINAGASSALSGLTLGASDVVLGSVMTGEERKRLLAHREAHDVVSGVANVAGSLAPVLLSAGSLAPSAIVSEQAARIAAAGAEAGNIGRVAGVVTGGAYEGAAQMAGAYLSDVALQDKDLSAEGFVGAVKSGALLGAASGVGAEAIGAGASKAWSAAKSLLPDVESAAAKAGSEATALGAFDLDDAASKEGSALQLEVPNATGRARNKSVRVRDLFADHAVAGDATKAAENEFADNLEQSLSESVDLEQATRQKLDEIRTQRMQRDSAVREKMQQLRVEQAELRVAAQREALGAKTAQREAAEARAARVKEGPKPRTKKPDAALDLPAETGTPSIPLATEADDPLMAQLKGTKAEIDAGADIGDLSRRHLEDTDDAVMKATEGDLNKQLDAHIAAGDPEFARVRDASDNLTAARERLDSWMEKYGKGGKVGRFERSQATRDVAESWRPKESGWYTNVPEREGNVVVRRGREMNWRGSASDLDAAERDIIEKYATSRTLEEKIADNAKVKLGNTSKEEIAEISALQARERARAADDLAARGRPTEQTIHDDVVRAAGAQASAAPEITATKVADAATHEAASAGVGALAKDNIDDMAEGIAVIGQYEQAVVDAMEVINPSAPFPAATRSAEGMKEAVTRNEAAAVTHATNAAEAAAGVVATPAGRAAVSDARAAAGPTADEYAGLAVTPGAVGKAASATPKAASTIETMGGVLEWMSTLGVPGIPKPSDIPVIGPLLGLYLKARALGTVARRLGGKIPETAETKIASKAAEIRTKAVRAVKRAMDVTGAVANGAKRAVIPSATQILSRKLLANGEDKDTDKVRGSVIERRVSELASFQQNRDSHVAAIKRSLPTRDPAVAQAVADAFVRKMTYLDSIAPKDPRPPMLVKSKWITPPGQVESFARAVRAVEEPLSVFDDIERGVCTPEATEALRAVYPRIFSEAQQVLVQESSELLEKLSYARRQVLSSLFDVALDATHTPQYLSWISQPTGAGSASGTSQPGTQPAPGSPPQPGIVADVSLSQSVMSSTDRRALR